MAYAVEGVGSGTGAPGSAGPNEQPPWQTDSGSSGISYKAYTSPDGPYGNIYPAGTLYSVGSNGSVSVDYTPPKGSSGGGGTTNYNTIMSGQLGANRYTTYQDAEGNTWQVDNLDGSRSIVQRAASNANPADKNNDGLDDTTNMANGVYKWDGSPTGYGYGQGVPVWPNGAPYTGGPMPGDYQTVTMYGPQGQGLYVVDQEYNVVKYLGPTTAAGAGGSTGSNSSTVRITGVSGSSGSSGGGSSSSYFDPVEYALQTKSMVERQQQLEALKYHEPNTVSIEGEANRAFQAQQNEIDRQARQQETAAERRLKAISEFRSAVTDTDPSAVHSWLYANGVGAGGNIVNRLAEGGDALSPNALAGAAALLQELRGGGQQAPMDWLNSVPGLAAATQPTTPGAGPGSPSPATPGPAAPPMSTGVPGTAGYDPGAPTTPPPNGGQWGQFRADDGSFYYQEIPGPNSKPAPLTPQSTEQEIIKHLTGKTMGETGLRMYELDNGMWYGQNGFGTTKMMTYDEARNERMNAGLRANMSPAARLLEQIYTDKDGVQRVMGTGSGQSVLSADGMSWVPMEGSTPDQVWNYGTSLPQLAALTGPGISYGTGPIGTDALGQKSGVSYYQTAGGAPAAAPTTPYGNDNIQREIPMTTQAVIPGLSRGGPVNSGMAVVGEGGGSKPLGSAELLIDPTRDAQVVPLTSQKAQHLMAQGLPGYATGTDGSWVYGGTITGGSTGAAGWDAMRAAPQEEAVQYSAPQPTYYPPQQPVYQQPYVAPVAPKPVAPKPATTSAYTPTPATAPTPTGTAGAPPPTGAATTSGVTSYADPRTAPASQPIAPNSNPMAPVVPPLPPSGVGFNESGGTYPVPVSTTPSPPGTPTAPGQPLQNATGSVYNTQNLTPEQLALLDEVTRVRATTPLPDIGNISPYSLMFKGLNPSSQTAWLQGMAARKGVPVGDFQWEIARQRAMMPGLSRASAATGY